MDTSGCQIYFTRHAQSTENIGLSMIDSPLTDEGRKQATKLTGNFDIVIVSPLRRCQETLHYSQIKYNRLIVNNNFRERIFSETNCLMFEYEHEESDEIFFGRTRKFQDELEAICKENPNAQILLVGHSYFFNSWYRKGCYPSPPNAQIMKIF